MDEQQIDARRSPVLLRELPDLAIALDGAAMRPRLQDALVGQEKGGFVIERCRPHKALYLPEAGCVVRYELEIRGSADGPSRLCLVGGRLYADHSASTAFLRERLAPLAALAGRGELAPFARPVSALDPLPMVVFAFPIDAELPTLVGATDPRRMVELFRGLPRDVLDIGVDTCRVEVAHYPRRGRCTLRYELEGTPSGSGDRVRRTVYGRVAAGPPARNAAAAALREKSPRGPDRFRVPRLLAFRPELSLSLVEAIPGVPQVAPLVAARVGAGPAPVTTLTLEEAVDVCARIAASLHTSDIEAGVSRSLDGEIWALRTGVSAVRRVSPELGAQLDGWTAQLGADAATLDPLPPVFCHGDYTPAQVLFDGPESGLLDFDTLCQAEAALDLGQFSAYLRVGCRRAERASPSATVALGDELCERFLQTYVDASGTPLEDEERLVGRARVYEAVSLVRMAVRSWEQLKPARTAAVLSILEERMACLPALVR